MRNNWIDNVKIKVCGMRDKQNISELVVLPVDYIGFIFFEKSKRFVGEEFDADFMSQIPDTVQKVGVFVNASEAYVSEKINSYSLDCVQFHGSESPDYCKTFNDKTTTIKAFGIDEDFDFSILEQYEASCDYFLFDTKSKDHGGTGVKFNWDILQQYHNEKPIFLSGGIGVHDTAEIKNLAWLNIHCIDLNSKFESEPGMKNVAELNRFIGILKA